MDLHSRIGCWLFASWHLNRMPPPTTSELLARRRRWCRDHCGEFAARWFALGAGFWLFFMFPLRPALPGEAAYAWPGIAALVAFVIGIWYIVRQIYAQSKVGPPPIDPPVNLHDDDHDRRR
ncbi:hypothetical protein [Arhodomonas sp. AD133]|uniref:hypothetical protein n=1 Tax=Arhodomonas sp. AD133 TaxID=3415009 RepID=UPI003EB8E87C